MLHFDPSQFQAVSAPDYPDEDADAEAAFFIAEAATIAAAVRSEEADQ